MLLTAFLLAWAIMAALLLAGRLMSRITERINDYYLRLSLPAALLCLAAGLVYIWLLISLRSYAGGPFEVPPALIKDHKWGTLIAVALILGSLMEAIWRRHLAGRQRKLAAPFVTEARPRICSWGRILNYRIVQDQGGFCGTVLHISDLHYCRRSQKTLEKVIAEATALKPDYIAVTGDFIQLGADPEGLKKLLAPLKARRAIFYVLGNHDFWTKLDRQVIKVLDGLNWRHLDEKAYDAEKLLILGSEAPWGPKKAGLAGPSEKGGRLTLALCHDPDEWPRLREAGASLTLSGHTHGGQIRLGPFGPIIIPSKNGALYGERLLAEKEKEGSPAVLFISRGLGKPYFRLCNSMEISLLTFGKSLS